MTDHRYLWMPKEHMSKRGAVRFALATIRATVPGMAGLPDTDLRSRALTYTTVNPKTGPERYRFEDFVNEAIAKGTIHKLARQPDPVFDGIRSIAVNESMKTKMAHMGHEIELAGPCQVMLVGPDLVDDILYYRREICERSTMAEFSTVARLYRAYVLCCTSLVEAFLNRYLWYFRGVGRITSDQFNSMMLSFEPRLDGWLKLLVPGRTVDDLKEVNPCWNHLLVLRRERNHFAHSPEPSAGLSLHNVCHGLNASPTGVAGTLAVLRQWLGEPPAAFLEPLANASEVEFKTARLPRQKTPRRPP